MDEMKTEGETPEVTPGEGTEGEAKPEGTEGEATPSTDAPEA